MLPRKLPRQSPAKFREETRLKQNLHQEQLKSVLSSPYWPDKPFIAVAKEKNLTYTVRIPVDCTYQLRRFVKNALAETENTARLATDTLDELRRLIALSFQANGGKVPRKPIQWQRRPPPRSLPALVAKAVKLAPASVVASMLGKLQMHDPKTLFTVIKQLAKLSKKARIAVDFCRERVSRQEPLGQHQSIADHIRDLFGRLPAGSELPVLEEFERVPDYVSKAEVEDALKRTGNKATGLDQLPIQLLKQPQLREVVLERCTANFNRWINAAQVPAYCKEAKVFALSKEETDFPQYGNVRTISVLPGVFKVFEKVVLAKV